MKRIKINVTKNDIKKGKRCQSGDCPIALAAHRKFKGSAVSVGPFTLGVSQYDHECWRDYTLPKAASNFILKFDCREKVEPFSFTIRATS